MQAPPYDWKPGDPIGYIQPDFPQFELPSYRGERYEALVPDTLDLQDRARMALHCMTEATNPLADYEIYGIVQFLCRPPQMQMDWGGPTVQVKFMQGVPLMRIICGDEKNLEVERKWMEVALKSQGDDGLIHTPVEGRPWTHRRYAGVTPPANGQLLVPFTCGKMITHHRRNYFAEDGAFLSGPGDLIHAHFHTHTAWLMTMLDYAQINDDPELMDFVKRGYEWGRELGVNTSANPSRNAAWVKGYSILGYFPEVTNGFMWESSEICEVADMITLALNLSEAGVGDYCKAAAVLNQCFLRKHPSPDNFLRPQVWEHDLNVGCGPHHRLHPFELVERALKRSVSTLPAYKQALAGRGWMTFVMNSSRLRIHVRRKD